MNSEQVVLIVIDMQRGMQAPGAGERNNPGAERNIESLLAAWRHAGWPVVSVRHISRTQGSPFFLAGPGRCGVPARVGAARD